MIFCILYNFIGIRPFQKQLKGLLQKVSCQYDLSIDFKTSLLQSKGSVNNIVECKHLVYNLIIINFNILILWQQEFPIFLKSINRLKNWIYFSEIEQGYSNSLLIDCNIRKDQTDYDSVLKENYLNRDIILWQDRSNC
ncbi:unnamed protein product [Paramecium sonneborni]|uniref:Uncharacterized protein n=1 Tax=Paramecium sonneborni TaxID=65129 RepID=A0A8S1QYX5_9CILI|nr:unnamed protein product [Paramecium sonneborni]